MKPLDFVRRLLWKWDAEIARDLSLRILDIAYKADLSKYIFPAIENNPVNVMGLTFDNIVGLAAGMDKNGDHIDSLAALGFGFLEIGTITPREQSGNKKPRLFMLPEHLASINRMGFNNLGIDHLIENVTHCKYKGVIGINIGKNFDTPIERAVDDYLVCLRKAYSIASYITVNISSPNTQNLRQLQQADESRKLIARLKEEQLKLQNEHGKYTPITLKIAPDLSDEDISRIAKLLLEFEIDGVIATNTTIARNQINNHPLAKEAGGLSGAPLTKQSTHVIKGLAAELNGKIPIIGVGGIMTAEDAQEKLAAGASLVQIYSGLIYQGQKLIADIIEGEKL
jgi:dihydroorotate dehydrogenase